MTVASLVAGATIFAAGPSSALPRDVCMDQLHYWQKVSWYEARASDASAVLDAWQGAAMGADSSGATSWSVNLPTGTIVVTSIYDYYLGEQKAELSLQAVHNAELTFIGDTTVCM